jgi:hypothetical protein
MKNRSFWQIVKTVLLFGLPLIINNQKGVKGTKAEKTVNDAADILKQL